MISGQDIFATPSDSVAIPVAEAAWRILQTILHELEPRPLSRWVLMSLTFM